MSENKILVERRGDIGIIRLNDPTQLNAVSLAMMDGLDAALDELVPSVRAILMTGVGRAFCSGAALGGGLGDETDFGLVLEQRINPLMSRLRDLPIPWISAVRGAAAGVGCSFALAADLIMASDTAYFLQAFSRIGLVPDGGSSYLLNRAIGRPRAMEMMLLGERVLAQQALDWGLINRVIPDDALDATALELAERLARGPTKTFGLLRKLAWTSADAHWQDALQAERELQLLAGRTNDAAEGIAAFMEKRASLFTGS